MRVSSQYSGDHSDCSTRGRWFRSILAIVLLLAVSPFSPFSEAQISGLGRNAGQSLLPAEKAFMVNAILVDAKTVLLQFIIAPGYYLYRDKIALAPDSSQVLLNFPRLPKGEEIEDEFLGRTEIYRNTVNIEVPLVFAEQPGAPFPLRVALQGCSENPAVCYPPDFRSLLIFPQLQKTAPRLEGSAAGLSGSSSKSNNTDSTDNTAGEQITSQQQQLALRLDGGNWLLSLVLFFGLGILLAFTPCILPILPVLTGLIVGGGQHSERTGVNWRALSLTSVYVLSMSIAYSFAGILAALAGASIQAALQNPLILSAVAVVILLLALAMFDFWQLQLPLAIRQLLSRWEQSVRGGNYIGAAILGALAALVLSPCVSPPLIGALLYIATTGDVWLGGSALFVMGLGLGVPLMILALAADRLLPRVGKWMQYIKSVLGLSLLFLAIWLLGRFLPQSLVLVLMGALFTGTGLWLWQISGHWKFKLLARTASAVLLVWGISCCVGGFSGGNSLVMPLNNLLSQHSEAAPSAQFVEVSDSRELQNRVATADRPVLLEVYAEWCVSCRDLENTTFSDPVVIEALDSVLLLRADVTENAAADRELLKELGIFGPPAILFFNNGAELRDRRVVGYIASQPLLARLNGLLPE